MRIIDEQLLKDLADQARRTPRRRKNLNLHTSYGDPCQRLLNALEPDTYVRPHRHLTPPKPESFVALRGRMALLVFDEGGAVADVVLFGAGGPVLGADIPPGVWHSIVCLERGSVFFEAKPGPYEPLSDKDFAPWAPEEGRPESGEYLAFMRRAVDEMPGPGKAPDSCA
ncbi:WbuC family cupin fold metalloprotein [uncultured Desulfuromonas sp.]|uniref:WbuC family cupin fold metalloprotein n=1 Tax=uncultured Desulfuromonas sp. TaxID=181013 RepID=UPI002633A4EB|nr:WbuC family cupin fold metalloprotein [uncultured Desulfuromonas sp.]